MLHLLDWHRRPSLELCLAIFKEGASSLRVTGRFVVDVWTRFLIWHNCCILSGVGTCAGHWMSLSREYTTMVICLIHFTSRLFLRRWWPSGIALRGRCRVPLHSTRADRFYRVWLPLRIVTTVLIDKVAVYTLLLLDDLLGVGLRGEQIVQVARDSGALSRRSCIKTIHVWTIPVLLLGRQNIVISLTWLLDRGVSFVDEDRGCERAKVLLLRTRRALDHLEAGLALVHLGCVLD